MKRILSLEQTRVIAPVSPLFVYLAHCESTMTVEFNESE